MMEEKKVEDTSVSDEKNVSEAEAKNKKIKNLTALVILLGGLFAGSLFVDFVQLIRGGGFSERMLAKSDIFNAGGKTWVAYEEPVITVSVVTDEECDNCKPDEVLVGLKRLSPTILTKKVEFDSEEGKKMVEDFGIQALPAFIFSEEVKGTDLYAQAGPLFVEEGKNLYLNAPELPVGRYLVTPQVGENDVKIGNEDAKVKIVEFSDFQCPVCKKMHEEVIAKTLEEYGDQVLFTFKHLPLNSIHPQAQNAALASECANEQGKFLEYGDLLFEKQDEWGKTEGTRSFKTYARQLGLNGGQFNACLDEEKYADKIQSDVQEAEKFHLTGTPATFVNDQFQYGFADYETFKSKIQQELE